MKEGIASCKIDKTVGQSGLAEDSPMPTTPVSVSIRIRMTGAPWVTPCAQ